MIAASKLNASRRAAYRCGPRCVAGLVFMFSVFVGARAADDVVEMKAVRAVSYDVYFAAHYDLETDAIAEIRVTDVKAGSTAEKLGVRKGDRITMIDGMSVVGRKRGELVNANKAIMLRGAVRFTGHRGLWRKEWSLTVDAGLLRKNPSDARSPAGGEPAKPGREASSPAK